MFINGLDKAKTQPPFQADRFRSGGAVIRIFVLVGATDFNSSKRRFPKSTHYNSYYKSNFLLELHLQKATRWNITLYEDPYHNP